MDNINNTINQNLPNHTVIDQIKTEPIKPKINKVLLFTIIFAIVLILLGISGYVLSRNKVNKATIENKPSVSTLESDNDLKSKESIYIDSSTNLLFFNKKEQRLDMYDSKANFVKTLYSNQTKKTLWDTKYCQKDNKLAVIYSYNENGKEFSELSVLDLKNNKSVLVEKLSYKEGTMLDENLVIDSILSFTSDCNFIGYQVSHQEGYDRSSAKIYSLELNKSVSFGDLSIAFWSPNEDYLISHKYNENNYSDLTILPKNQLLERIKNSGDIFNLTKYDLSKTGIDINNVYGVMPTTFLEENSLILNIAYKGETNLISAGILDIKTNKFISKTEDELVNMIGGNCSKGKGTGMPCGYQIYFSNPQKSDLVLVERSGYIDEKYFIKNSKTSTLLTFSPAEYSYFSGWFY